jgi:hypothetical protein
VVTHRKEGVTDIFLGGASMWTPARHLTVSGWANDPVLSDLDGDGWDDLVIPAIPEVDFPTAVNVMASGTIEVRNHIFLNTRNREAPFKTEPTVVRRLQVRIRLYLDATGRIAAERSILVDWNGDFNSDGRRDLIYREGTKELRLYYGRAEGVFSMEESYSVIIPDTSSYASLDSIVKDMNGDGRPDVLIYYQSRDRKGDRLVLVLSTGK